MCDSRRCTTPDLPDTFTYISYTFSTPKDPDPITLHICTPCTGRILTDYAPILNGRRPRAFLKCLIMDKLSLHCSNCLAFFRIERISPHTNTFVPNQHYCPHCGAQQIASLDPERDYWEIIADGLNLTVELTHTLYDAWLYDPVHPRFRDFVEALERDVAS